MYSTLFEVKLTVLVACKNVGQYSLQTCTSEPSSYISCGFFDILLPASSNWISSWWKTSASSVKDPENIWINVEKSFESKKADEPM